MSVTKVILNAIYKALKPHKDSVEHIQALFMWNRRLYSAMFLIVIEAIFVLAFLLPFSRSCNYCIVIGSVVFCYCVYGAFPAVCDRILAFEIKPWNPTRQTESAVSRRSRRF